MEPDVVSSPAEGDAVERAAPGDPPSWYPETFDRLSDLVIVLGPDGTVRHNNPFAEELLGHGRGDLVGTSMADHLAPADLDRALEVIGLLVTDTLNVPVTPAVYEVRHRDGTFLPVEINATDLAGIDDGCILIFGRYSGDRHLQDRVLQALTNGAPIEETLSLIPQLGLWRHPDEHYAVHYRSADGTPRVVGTDLAVEMGQDLGPGMPWDIASDKKTDSLFTAEDVAARSAPLAEKMRLRGLTHCWVFPVDDPLGTSACAIVWSTGDEGPTFHRYALEIMQRSLDLALRWRQQVMTLTDAAHRDALTGLANRTGFFAAIEKLRATGERHELALLYIDLDGFKAVNDEHGHLFGDGVLVEAGRRIAEGIRPVDLVARLGGDEFAVLCTSLRTVDDAVVVADRILAAVAAPYESGGITTQVGASIGIAVAESATIDVDQLVHAADQALYEAKHAGRNRWELRTDPL